MFIENFYGQLLFSLTLFSVLIHLNIWVLVFIHPSLDFDFDSSEETSLQD